MDAKELSEHLSQNALSVAQYLYPQGKREGHNWRIGDINGKQGDSLSICISGPKSGHWKDFSTGQGGDLIDLFQAYHRCSTSDAFYKAKDFLGCNDTQSRLKPVSNKQEQALVELPHPLSSIDANQKATLYLESTRKLSPEIIQRFQLKAHQQTIVFPYLSEDSKLLHWKAIGFNKSPEGKKQMFANKGACHRLFGWHALPKDTRQVVICEGEIDCITLAMNGIPVLSVPNGCQSLQWIDAEWHNLERFDDIILALDGDEPGKKAMASIIERLGRHRCRIVDWSEWGGKDPNELLQNGYSHDVFNAIVSEAKALDPETLKPVLAYEGEVIERVFSSSIHQGLELPWPTFENRFHVRDSELTIVTGRNGSGKSQLMGQVMHHLMTQGQRVCIASMEMKPSATLHRMIQQITSQSQPSKEEIKQAFEWLNEKLWMVNVLGSIKGDELLEVFEYAYRRYGVNQFVIDSLMRCGLREDDYSGQNEFVQKLCDFKLKTKGHVWLVSHPRKGESENQAPTKLDVRGASAITDNADNVWSLWRNPRKRENLNGFELTNQGEPDATITVGKQRNGDGWEGHCYLWFDPHSKRFMDERPPVPNLKIG